MRRSDFATLFRRRPNSATIGLGIAAMSFLATAISNLIVIVSNGVFGILYFDFIFSFSQISSSASNPLNWKQALVAVIWSLIGLFACYMSLEPRNVARFTVIVACGVKLFTYLSFTETTFSIFQYFVLLLIAALPIILLLTKSSNSYYGRNQ